MPRVGVDDEDEVVAMARRLEEEEEREATEPNKYKASGFVFGNVDKRGHLEPEHYDQVRTGRAGRGGEGGTCVV